VGDRLFLDSGFYVARFSPHDQYHQAARRLAQRADEARELWTSEAILLEVAAAFRVPGRRAIAARIWDQSHGDHRCHVVSISGPLLERGMELFRSRPDKAWTLADCTSFVLMGDQQLSTALTCDQHFVQAGFRALLLEEAQ
jgi:hypothetical protein